MKHSSAQRHATASRLNHFDAIRSACSLAGVARRGDRSRNKSVCRSGTTDHVRHRWSSYGTSGIVFLGVSCDHGHYMAGL